MLGPIITSIPNTELSLNDRELLKDPFIGGVILFAENFIDKQQLKDLVQSIKEIKSPELLVFVDQEGGRIQRFKNDFFRLPSHRDLGKVYDQNKDNGIRSAELTGFIMAAELLAEGVDLSFSPVVDIDYGISRVISDRSFHSDPYAVSEMAKSFMKGMKDSGMKAVAKHFPGHGSVALDSHTDQPVDPRSFDEIEKDIKPYIELIANDLNGIMTAHIIYTSIDNKISTFSSKWLKEILREKLSYEGIIFSDDLTMQSAVEIGSMQDRINQSLHAGCDLILWCHPDESIKSILNEFSESLIDKTAAYEKIRPAIESIDQKELDDRIEELTALLNKK